MKDFLDAIGVQYKAVDMIKDKFGTDIPAVAVAKLAEMTLEVMEGKMDITTLPEEASHFYIKLLGEDSGLYKAMFNSISNYPVFDEVVKRYSERYKDDQKLLREEAMGKLIADRIVNGVNTSLPIRQQEQSNNWWTKLWNTIKELFSRTKSDPYAKAAYDILSKDTSRLLNTVNEVVEIEENMYQLDDSDLEQQWEELPFTNKGLYKYDYRRTTDEAESAYNGYISQFGVDNVTMLSVADTRYKAKIAIKKPKVKSIDESIVEKEDNAMDNMRELAKAPIELKAEQLVLNFNTYFPDMSHLETEEKENIMKAIEGGEFVISCKF
jgi:hypothetical protein